jgi:hypothetical protein
MAHVEKSKSPIRERRVVEHVVVEERVPVGVSAYSLSGAGMAGGVMESRTMNAGGMVSSSMAGGMASSSMAGRAMESRTVTQGGMVGGSSHLYTEKLGERSRSPLRHNKN